jgi:hypothetical protein
MKTQRVNYPPNVYFDLPANIRRPDDAADNPKPISMTVYEIRLKCEEVLIRLRQQLLVTPEPKTVSAIKHWDSTSDSLAFRANELDMLFKELCSRIE